jgi:hypothetical protein
MLAVLFTLCWASPGLARVPDVIDLPTAGGIPESLSVAADGTVIVGSATRGLLMRAAPGSSQANVWVTLTGEGPVSVLGVLVDDRANLVRVCASETPPGGQRRSALRTFNLKTGAAEKVFPAPAGAGCNDVAVSSDGVAYVTDTPNRRILRLKPGGAALEPWFQDDRLVFVNGVTFVDGKMYVGCSKPAAMFRIDIGPGGAATGATPIELSRPMKIPDGIRGIGKGRILVAEMGGDLIKDGIIGQAVVVSIDGNKGTVTTLADGIMGPSAISPAGPGEALILEAKTQYRVDPVVRETDPGRTRAFRVKAP